MTYWHLIPLFNFWRHIFIYSDNDYYYYYFYYFGIFVICFSFKSQLQQSNDSSNLKLTLVHYRPGCKVIPRQNVRSLFFCLSGHGGSAVCYIVLSHPSHISIYADAYYIVQPIDYYTIIYLHIYFHGYSWSLYQYIQYLVPPFLDGLRFNSSPLFYIAEGKSPTN